MTVFLAAPSIVAGTARLSALDRTATIGAVIVQLSDTLRMHVRGAAEAEALAAVSGDAAEMLRASAPQEEKP